MLRDRTPIRDCYMYLARQLFACYAIEIPVCKITVCGIRRGVWRYFYFAVIAMGILLWAFGIAAAHSTTSIWGTRKAEIAGRGTQPALAINVKTQGPDFKKWQQHFANIARRHGIGQRTLDSFFFPRPLIRRSRLSRKDIRNFSPPFWLILAML